MTLDAEVQIDRKVKKYGGHVSKGDVESTETTGPDNLESDWKPTKESIAKDLNGDATSTFWVGSAYLVPSAGFQPIMASFSDVYGRRRVLAMALALFVIGSIVGCLAHNMATLLAGRVIQGIGGGGLIPLATIIITDVVPLRPRPKYAALVQASMALGTILGPLIGGAFLEHTSSSTGWRWVFYINFPLSTAAGILLFFSVRFKRGGAQLRAVDWFGQALFLASISIFLIGLSWGGVQYTWESYHTLVPLCLGVGGIVATVCWEILGTEHPFVRISVLQDRSALAVYAGSIVQGILMYGELYYISVYLQAVKSMSAVMTGVGLLPVSVALMPTSIVVAIFISKTGRYRWALWFGWAATIAATGVTIILDSDTNTASWIFIFAFVGFGHGVLFNALLISAQASCAAADAAYAASMYTFFRTLGFAIGVIIGSTVLQNFMSMKLHELDLPTAIAQNAEGFIETLKTLASGSALREGVLTAYVYALDSIFEVLTGIGVLGLLATAFVAAKTMNKPIESDHVLHDTCDSAKN
ncbi:putative integral membrane protein [Aspergillus niger]|uniref:Putative integral membrane protein n=2 Tax=Aspergillus niger TaxID=5061 RepID=A0A505IG46_ASPNG|nr:putative integral membrane protein [Aspergillus niger]